MDTQEQCIVDGKPLSDSEIAIIRVMREFHIFTILDDLKEQFNAESVNDNKSVHLSWSDVLTFLCYDMVNTLPCDVARAIEILKIR